MIILGIDPGIARTGWGVVLNQNSKIKSQNYGCIETDPGIAVEKRLLKVYKQVTDIINTYRPDCVAIEELFFNTNAKTAMVVGQARGVILLAASEHALPLFVYTPLQVKIAITGYGRAEKGQMGKMIQTLLHLKTIPKPDDISDALAVALTHAFSYKKYIA